MILNSQPLSEFASIRVNWWSVSSQCPATPSLPILPILPQIHGALMQNKANYQKVKTAVTSCAEGTYPEYPAPPDSKKQTQSNPICRGEASSEAATNPNLSRRSRIKPNSSRKHPASSIENLASPHATRNPQYAIRPQGIRLHYLRKMIRIEIVFPNGDLNRPTQLTVKR